MKKIFKKFGLSLAAMACVVCAGFGVALGFSKDVPTAKAATITELPDSDYYIASAGLRLINDADGAALRFNTNLIADQYDNVVESGTLIIPEVRYDGQLTLDDLNNAAKYQPAHVVTKGKVNGKDVDLWYDFGEVGGDTFMRTTAYLYDIPEVWYGARMIAVSYIKDANGNIKYTTVLDEVDGVRMNRYSMSDVASRFANSAEYADRVAPYIVDEVTLTYNMPDGSKQTETVAYGSKVSEISFDYNKSAYAFLGFEDQYGRTLDLANEEITLPLTLTPVFKTLQGENVVFNNMITDDYAADNTYRAFNNSTNPDVITTDVPEGYSAIYSYEAYGESQSFWKANGNPLYRSAYNDIDISGYDLIRFAMKVTTDGDAGIAVYPVLPNGNRVDTQVAKWIRNEWVEVQLEQTAANTWKMTLTNLTTGERIHESVEYTRNANDITDVDSVSSLVFMACKWDSQTPTLFVMPGSEATMKSSVQFTEVLGYNELDYAPSVDSTVVADSGFKTGYGLTAAEADGETVPAGFSSVSKYMTDTSKWTSSALNSTVYSSDITAYEELWVAYKITGAAYWKMHNGTDYNNKVRLNGTNAWVNYHLIQTSDSTWTIEARIRGALVAKAEGVSGNNIHSILWRSGYSNGFLIYSTDYTKSVPFYATEVRGILKDGVTLPDTDVDFDPEIPDNALVVRSYTWRDDKYALSASTTESAPVGYQNVVEFNWLDNPKNWAETVKDFPDWAPANDLSAYSDVYYAMKYVTDSGMVYNRGGAHYTGSDWLYVHLKQDMSEHTWSLSVKSPDGYEMVSSRTSTAMNLKSLMAYGELGFYPNKTITGDNIATKAIAYFTEMLAVPVAMEMGERAIWSAVDKAVPTDDAIGIPAGFTSLYKYVNFTMDKFAALDLSNTVYEELSFGMLASVDFTFDTGYKYVSDGSEVTTSIMYNTGSRPQMYVVYLTNGGNGNWTITMNVRRWTPVGQIADTETFSANVTGNSIQEIMDKVLSPAANMTLYVTEVRGSHTCVVDYYGYLENGTHQGYCDCGEKVGDAETCTDFGWVIGEYICLDCEHVYDKASWVDKDGLYRDYEKYTNTWLKSNSDVSGVTLPDNFQYITRADSTDQWKSSCVGSGYFSEMSLVNYKEAWVGYKLVNAYFAMGNQTVRKDYAGTSWVIFHLIREGDSLWTIEAIVDGKVHATFNAQTGETLQKLLYDNGWASSDGQTILFYTKGSAEAPVTVSIYTTEILGVPVDFVDDIPEAALEISETAHGNASQLTTTDEPVPAGFDKVMKYEWTSGKEYSGSYDKTDITAYDYVYFAMKLTGKGALDVWIRGGTYNYERNDWLYVYLTQTDKTNNLWSVSVKSPDGFELLNVQNNVKGTSISSILQYISNGVGNGLYPRRIDTTTPATLYFTEVRGFIACDEHTADKYVCNEDGTHKVYCSTCNTFIETVNCEYTWNDKDQYICDCGYVKGAVNTNLEKQTVALYTNATADNFKANETTAATIKGITTGDLNATVNSVALNGEEYSATFENGNLMISVMPKDVFGEYTLTANITIEGKEFDITASILVVTDLIKTPQGMLDMKYVLRGEDKKGGITTMNGDGYYMLDCDVTMFDITTSKNVDYAYVYGTTTVPFVGTFDGNGHVLDGYRNTQWFSYDASTKDKWEDADLIADITAGTVSPTGDDWRKGYLQGSLFGVMDGLVKNVAFTNVRFGIYSNFAHSGCGTFEDIYVQIVDYQDLVSNTYVSPFFSRAERRNAGTLRNVVVDISSMNYTNLDNLTTRGLGATADPSGLALLTGEGVLHGIHTLHPAAVGKGFAAENVAVYGYTTKYTNYTRYAYTEGKDANNNITRKITAYSTGMAMLYQELVRNGNLETVPTNGEGFDGIYVEYADHSENNAIFRKVALDSNLWKVVTVNGFDIPMLKSVNATADGSAPEGFDGTIEDGAGFNIVWGDSEVGSFDAVKFITETTSAAVTDTKKKLVPAGFDSTLEANQIVVGTYETYGNYVKELLVGTNALATTDAANYGVYKVGNTVFVLAESEEAFMFAAKEFCRQAYGWQQLSHTLATSVASNGIPIYGDPDIYMNTGRSLADSIGAIKAGYTTQVAFTQRKASNGLYKTYDPNDFGSNNKEPYSNYVEMHNTLDYFGTKDADGKYSYTYGTSVLKVAATNTDGTAQVTDNDDKIQWQLCYLGHGDKTVFEGMISHVANQIVTQAMANKNMTAINFMLEDNTYYCKCSACAAFSQPATPQLVFLNELAKTLRANEQLQAYNRTIDVEFFSYNAYSPAPTLRDSDITALNGLKSSLGIDYEIVENVNYKKQYTDKAIAYGDKINNNTFPTTVLKAEDGLRLYWTSHEANHSFDLEHEANAHMYLGLLGWIASIGAENIDVFMYQAAYRDYFIPLNTWEYQLNWYKSLNKLGVNNYMFNLGNIYNAPNAQTGFAAFKSYIDSRAMTDINVTFEQLKDEFFGVNGYYGPAGPTMRDYFEELVSVYEGHKQGATNQFAAKSTEYTDVFFSNSGSYVAGWIHQSIDGKHNTDYNLQAFFNGSYGLNQSKFVFAEDSYKVDFGSNTGDQTAVLTTRNNVYHHSNYGSQLDTLVAWYNYCQTALALEGVSGNATYTKRINVEALFPEYACLLLESECQMTFTRSYKSSAFSFVSAEWIAPTVGETQLNYQDFYTRVIGLGVSVPSEFYNFDSTKRDDATTPVDKLGGRTIEVSYKNLLNQTKSIEETYTPEASFFVNWGVTF